MNRNDAIFYRTKNKKICYKVYGFLSFARKYEKELLDKGLHAVKKVVHKLGEYLVNKIADAITKSNDDNIEKHEPVEGIIIPPEKGEEI